MNILDCVNKLFYEVEEDEKHRGLGGKFRKYSGDIAAGALGALAGTGAAAYSKNPALGALVGAGIYGAYKLHDVKSGNYDKANKTKSGSLIGALTGRNAAAIGTGLYVLHKSGLADNALLHLGHPSIYDYSDD